jgi:hypothetical protein
MRDGYYDEDDLYEGDDYYDSYPEERDERADPYVEQAKEELKEFFEDNRRVVVYARELEIRFEKDYFHWVTARAVEELVGEGRIIRRERRKLKAGAPVSFLFHKGLRRRQRIIGRKLKVLERYVEAASVRVRIGDHAEMMFLAGFAERGYVCRARNVKEYGGKRWKKSSRDLDFVLEGSGGVWGCEVKNRLDYMEAAEVDEKVKMCKLFGVRPLFIVRRAPKTHIERVRLAGGFTMVFEMQVWPSGQEELLKEVKEVLRLPVDSPRAIPGGIFDRFEGWLAKKRQRVARKGRRVAKKKRR